VVANNIVGQLLDLLRLTAIVKMFEMAEAHMALGHPHQHRTGLHALAVDRGIAGHHRQGARRRDPQSVHRLRRQTFPDRRAQHGAAVPHPRIRSQAGAFQMPVVTAAIRQLLLAEQDPASVAQLAGPGAKLMAAVYLRQRRHARKQRFAAPDTGPAFRRKQGVGHPQLLRQRGVAPDESGVIQRRW